MGISRPTFHRVLASARAKITDALITGKAIRIQGGDFELVNRRFRCGKDGHEWDVAHEEIDGESMPECPRCRGENVELLDQFHNRPGKGHGRGRCGR